MAEIIPTENIEDAIIEQTNTSLTAEEVEAQLVKIEFETSKLVWHNFRKEQPEVDRPFVLFCPMGTITPNLFITHRDAIGNYDLPHPTKRYNATAWAYIDIPQIIKK